MTLHTSKPGEYVWYCIISEMSKVQIPRRIWKHRQYIHLLPRRLRPLHLRPLFPYGLPFFIELVEVDLGGCCIAPRSSQASKAINYARRAGCNSSNFMVTYVIRCRQPCPANSICNSLLHYSRPSLCCRKQRLTHRSFRSRYEDQPGKL